MTWSVTRILQLAGVEKTWSVDGLRDLPDTGQFSASLVCWMRFL